MDWEREMRCQDVVEIEVGFGLTGSTHRCRGAFACLVSMRERKGAVLDCVGIGFDGVWTAMRRGRGIE